MDGKSRNLLRLLPVFALALHATASLAASVTGLDFKQGDGAGQIEIKADGPVTFEKQESAADKQVILDVKGASLPKKFQRPIDTSSFNGNVLLVSPYPGSDAGSFRVVVQMRDAGAAEVTQDGNTIKVSVPGGQGAAATAAGNVAAGSPPAPAADAAPAATPPGASPSADAAAPPAQDTAQAAAPAATTAPGDSGKDKIDQFLENETTKRFSGKPVTLQVRDADVNDVLRLISQASGFNIVVGSDVQGKITLDLVDVPWDQSLDVLLHTMKLGAERNNNILRVVTLSSLTQEKQAELAAQTAQKASAPRVTKIFQINYADPNVLVTELKALLAPTVAGGGEAMASTTGVFQVDVRTNSIILRDLPENIDKAKKLIELLDAQTPQILIEAKIVEASEGFAKTISGALGAGGQGSNSWLSTFNGGNPLDPLIGSPGVFGTGQAAGQTSGGGGVFGFSPSVSFIPGVQRLNALLQLNENESELKVISSPKLVVANTKQATITQGTPVLLPPSSTFANGATVVTANVVTANLMLSATPTVNNEGSVMLQLNLERDVPFDLGGTNSAVANRNMQTVVLVESGTTLVMGGIYTATSRHSSSGFPVLRKIPIIGALFGDDRNSTDRSELFFFITPRILNSKEAGLAGT